MKVRILGASGGIGGRHLRTTAFLVDHDILMDAGTGVGDLSIAELAQIDHVFVTHAHLDHIACIPFMVDAVGDMRNAPLTVHASEATLDILRSHVFNDLVWPDFRKIPSPENPFLRFEVLHLGQPVTLGGRSFTALPANHTVPAVGYRIDSGRASLVFTGDTGPCPELWQVVNEIDNLRYLIIETAFPNREHRLATVSKHLCPSMLAMELSQLKRDAEIFITHLKPGQVETTMAEIGQGFGRFQPRRLQNDEVFEF